MQTSEHYKLKIPEARDGLFKIIELYKDLFHAFDALVFSNRFIGVEFSHEMRSKLNNIQIFKQAIDIPTFAANVFK